MDTCREDAILLKTIFKKDESTENTAQLEELISQLAVGSLPEVELRFYDLLLNSILTVALIDAPISTEQSDSGFNAQEIAILKNVQGTCFAAAFTNAAAAKRWRRSEGRYTQLPTRRCAFILWTA